MTFLVIICIWLTICLTYSTSGIRGQEGSPKISCLLERRADNDAELLLLQCIMITSSQYFLQSCTFIVGHFQILQTTLHTSNTYTSISKYTVHLLTLCVPSTTQCDLRSFMWTSQYVFAHFAFGQGILNKSDTLSYKVCVCIYLTLVEVVS